MKDMNMDHEYERQRAVTEAALESVRRDKLRREAQGYAVMAAVTSMGESIESGGRLAKSVELARFGCIAFLMILPNFLIWYLLLN